MSWDLNIGHILYIIYYTSTSSLLTKLYKVYVSSTATFSIPYLYQLHDALEQVITDLKDLYNILIQNLNQNKLQLCINVLYIQYLPSLINVNNKTGVTCPNVRKTRIIFIRLHKIKFVMTAMKSARNIRPGLIRCRRHLSNRIYIEHVLHIYKKYTKKVFLHHTG